MCIIPPALDKGASPGEARFHAYSKRMQPSDAFLASPCLCFSCWEEKLFPGWSACRRCPSMLEAILCSMGIKEAKCPFPIHYTNLDTHPRVNCDQSSDGQHRKVNNRPWAQYKTPVSSTSSKSILSFTQHPHCTLLASLKSQVFSKQAHQRVQKQGWWPPLG